MNTILAQDIMTENVVTIHADMLISQAAHLMLRDRVMSFPVVRGDNELMGIISITDLFKLLDAAQAHRRDFRQYVGEFKNLRVAEVMTPEVVTITPETALTTIVRMLIDQHIHTFPVVQEGKLVGIVGRHDILNAVFSYL
jgi:CBS domain-containing protein